MNKSNVYNLEERTYLFAKECRLLINMLPKSLSNIEDGKQLIKSSGSVGANYIEANEKLGDRDFKFRLKIARKEAKESQFWLILLKDFNPDHAEIISNLIEESEQLRKIFSSIILKS